MTKKPENQSTASGSDRVAQPTAPTASAGAPGPSAAVAPRNVESDSNRGSSAAPQSRSPVTQSSSEEGQSKSHSSDVVLIHGVTEDNKGLRVLRAKDGNIEVGEVRPLVSGQPINHDVVRLKPREGMPYVCDVETTYSPQRSDLRQKSDEIASKKRTGPAQVATQAYRENWDAIWSRSRSSSGNELN